MSAQKLMRAQAAELSTFLFRLLPWGLPLGGIAAWMVYPALNEPFKEQLATFLGLAKKE